MKIAAIIQARTGSTRLPNKILLNLSGKPILKHVLERTKKSKLINEIIVATTNLPEDNIIFEKTKEWGVNCFKGDEKNVLKRYYNCAKNFKVDIIVRITSDCPLIDTEIVDEGIKDFIKNKYDYYFLDGKFPEGLNFQIITFKALEKTYKEASLPSEKEHVCLYTEKYPETFKTGKLIKKIVNERHRWTLDHPEDFLFFQEIYQKFLDEKIYQTTEILNIIKANPEIRNINLAIPEAEWKKKVKTQDKDYL